MNWRDSNDPETRALGLARYYRSQAKNAAEKMERSPTKAEADSYRTMCHKYNHMFNAVAAVLRRNTDDLWYDFVEEERRDAIPLFTRLSRLTNSPASGIILPQDKD